MYRIPTYQEAVALTVGKRYVAEIDQYLDAAFYEAKLVVDGYRVSVFDSRATQTSGTTMRTRCEALPTCSTTTVPTNLTDFYTNSST